MADLFAFGCGSTLAVTWRAFNHNAMTTKLKKGELSRLRFRRTGEGRTMRGLVLTAAISLVLAGGAFAATTDTTSTTTTATRAPGGQDNHDQEGQSGQTGGHDRRSQAKPAAATPAAKPGARGDDFEDDRQTGGHDGEHRAEGAWRRCEDG